MGDLKCKNAFRDQYGLIKCQYLKTKCRYQRYCHKDCVWRISASAGPCPYKNMVADTQDK